MLKRFVTVIIVSLFVSGMMFAQDKSVKKVLLDESKIPTVGSELIPGIQKTTLANEVGTTSYDYFTNSLIRDQILFYDGKPHMAPMLRGWGNNPNRRAIVYITKDGANWVKKAVFDTASNSGWPQIDVQLTGNAIGTLGIVGHTPNRLGIYDGTNFLVSSFDPNTDPSLQFAGDKIFIAHSGNRVQFKFVKTTDYGVSFSTWDSISHYSPLPTYWVENGGVEVGMIKSPDEKYLAMFGTNDCYAGDAGSAHAYDGLPLDSCDNIWALTSSNSGQTWTMNRVAEDGVIGLVANYPVSNFAPLFENFGQLDACVGNNGVYHMLANGYGLSFNATLDSSKGPKFPVLYWNSQSKKWKSISDIKIDTISAIADYYPTNSIGQAYPSISTSADGKVLYAMWTAPQVKSNFQLDTLGSGGGATYYWRDIMHSYSVDGGNTWTAPTYLPGANETNRSEAFGHSAQLLQDAGTKYIAHIIYLSDLNTGVSLFASGGPATNNPVMYTTFEITKPSSVGDNTILNNFELSQNYPNPFNPSTVIKYSVGERVNVSVKVYDLLGKEVASLVNDVKDAGSYEVTFDASKLASGMYIYKINAGNYSASKKMMLMK